MSVRAYKPLNLNSVFMLSWYTLYTLYTLEFFKIYFL